MAYEPPVIDPDAVDDYSDNLDDLGYKSELDPEESLEYIEWLTQKNLGMSVDEFRRRAEDGTLPRHPAVPHLVLMTDAKPQCRW